MPTYDNLWQPMTTSVTTSVTTFDNLSDNIRQPMTTFDNLSDLLWQHKATYDNLWQPQWQPKPTYDNLSDNLWHEVHRNRCDLPCPTNNGPPLVECWSMYLLYWMVYRIYGLEISLFTSDLPYLIKCLSRYGFWNPSITKRPLQSNLCFPVVIKTNQTLTRLCTKLFTIVLFA